MIGIAKPQRNLDHRQIAAGQQGAADIATADLVQLLEGLTLGFQAAAQGPARHAEPAGDGVLIAVALTHLLQQQIKHAVADGLLQSQLPQMRVQGLDGLAKGRVAVRAIIRHRALFHQAHRDDQPVLARTAPDAPDAPRSAPRRGFAYPRIVR